MAGYVGHVLSSHVQQQAQEIHQLRTGLAHERKRNELEIAIAADLVLELRQRLAQQKERMETTSRQWQIAQNGGLPQDRTKDLEQAIGVQLQTVEEIERQIEAARGLVDERAGQAAGAATYAAGQEQAPRSSSASSASLSSEDDGVTNSATGMNADGDATPGALAEAQSPRHQARQLENQIAAEKRHIRELYEQAQAMVRLGTPEAVAASQTLDAQMYRQLLILDRLKLQRSEPTHPRRPSPELLARYENEKRYLQSLQGQLQEERQRLGQSRGELDTLQYTDAREKARLEGIKAELIRQEKRLSELRAG